jgi:hypothetical protein
MFPTKQHEYLDFNYTRNFLLSAYPYVKENPSNMMNSKTPQITDNWQSLPHSFLC